MKKKIDIARSSAERDLTISTTNQIEALWNGHEAGGFQRSRIDGRCSSHQARRSGVCAGVCICSDAHLGLAKGNNPSSYYYMKFFSLFINLMIHCGGMLYGVSYGDARASIALRG